MDRVFHSRMRQGLLLLTSGLALVVVLSIFSFQVSILDPTSGNNIHETNLLAVTTYIENRLHTIRRDESLLEPIDNTKAKPNQNKKDDDGIEQQVAKRCPKWPKRVVEAFSRECPYWLARLDQWNRKPHVKQVGYLCSRDEFCTGWGDRVAGIASVFYRALTENGHLRIGMDGLPGLIDPCLLHDDSWSFKEMPWNGTCKGKFNNCDNWLAMHCPSENNSNQDVLAYNLDRACTPPDVCREIQEKSRAKGQSESVANILGCALKILIDPSDEVWYRTRYPLRIGESDPVEMSLKEMDAVFDQYYVIAIHIRLGDLAAFFTTNLTVRTAAAAAADREENVSEEPPTGSPHFLYPFRCAETLESAFLSKPVGDDVEIIAPDGRPVKWFLATDSHAFKTMARNLFPKRLITLELPPRHVSFSFDLDSKETLKQTMFEWYLVGRGEELVLNKLMENHIGIVENDFHLGRVSGFAKTSRTYHLKSDRVDAATCLRSSLPQKGTWKYAGCKSSHVEQETETQQRHLKPLKELGLKFPSSWIRRGRIQGVNTRRSSLDRGKSGDESSLLSEEDDDPLTATEIAWKVFQANKMKRHSPKERQRNLRLWTFADENEEVDDDPLLSNRTLKREIEIHSTVVSVNTKDIQPTRMIPPSCIPSICAAPKSFIPPSKSTMSKGYVYLTSFPGSGNTWLRRVIEDGTRVFTGSDYDDLELRESGFKGEGPRILYESNYSKVSVVKTHFPMFGTSPHPAISALIVLVRCPYDALFAEFNRQYSLGHTKVSSLEDSKTRFPAYFRSHYPLWLKSVRYFMQRKYWKTSIFQEHFLSMDASPTVPVKIRPFTNDLALGDRLSFNLTLPSLIVFYEDLVTDFDRTTAGIFSFLRHRLGDALDVTAQQAHLCALIEHLRHPQRGKRKQQEVPNGIMNDHDTFNPYTDPESEFSERPWMIESFCSEVADYWWEEKWGRCRDAPYLQSERLRRSNEHEQLKKHNNNDSVEAFVNRYCRSND